MLVDFIISEMEYAAAEISGEEELELFLLLDVYLLMQHGLSELGS